MHQTYVGQQWFLRSLLINEPCKEYALYIPPHGKRKPGRQRTLFLRYIQHLLGDTDNMIGPGKLSELAQDRCGWRKLDDDDWSIASAINYTRLKTCSTRYNYFYNAKLTFVEKLTSLSSLISFFRAKLLNSDWQDWPKFCHLFRQ